MKKILKGTVVLLIAVAMIASTAGTAETVKEINESQMDPTHIRSTNLNPSRENNMQPLMGPVLFLQRPYRIAEVWAFYTSDVDMGYICVDDFWDLTDEICDIHWWGLSGFWNGNRWEPGDPSGMVFEIVIYDYSENPVCAYQVTPGAQGTGKFYTDFEMYYWETDLVPCCPLNAGWVSIQSISSPNTSSFLWAGSPQGNWNAKRNWVAMNPKDNLSFELTAEGPPHVICCDPGQMDWRNVPGSTVTGTFFVWNCGDDGSILIWSVDSWPAWMTSAVFNPPGGNLVGGGPGQDVQFTFTAPTNPYTTFSGTVKVINVDAPSDYCEMDTTFDTPRSRGTFSNIFEYLMNQFPMLKILFGL